MKKLLNHAFEQNHLQRRISTLYGHFHERLKSFSISRLVILATAGRPCGQFPAKSVLSIPWKRFLISVLESCHSPRTTLWQATVESISSAFSLITAVDPTLPSSSIISRSACRYS